MTKSKKIYLYVKVFVTFFIQTRYLTARRIDHKLWRKKFYNLIESEDHRSEELLNEFLTCEIKKISENKVKRRNRFSPILICVIKNDLEKIKSFMSHYRKLGIEVFVFLDNESTDGTREYLCKQQDTIVYSSSQEYSSARRVAWINRLLAIYGENRWCLVVDSDELVDFIGSETQRFSDIVKYALTNSYKRIEGFMLDMYSENGLFDKQENDFVSTMNWFDKDTYTLRGRTQGLVIQGGPRTRIFKKKEEQILSKYPLFYFGEEDFVASSHYMVPAVTKKYAPVCFAIRHYKFIDGKDLEKIKEAVAKENYAGNSADYKAYLALINKNGKISFYNERNSIQYNSSEDFRNIAFLENMFSSR